MSAIHTAGIDVGSSAVKSAVVESENGSARLLAKQLDRIRQREVRGVIEDNFAALLKKAGRTHEELVYVASTGEGELVSFRTGHFFGMTTHARGASHLMPGVRSVVDLGALHTRAMVIDERSKILRSGMTGQCASGSGQFLENIARYIGVTAREAAELSLQADAPEPVSAVCAVLAETDVINMVSRGISKANILKGVHLSMVDRLVKLLRSVKAESPVALTGGLAANFGLVAALKEAVQETGWPLGIRVHEDSVFAGAIGAALWGARRWRRLREQGA